MKATRDGYGEGLVLAGKENKDVVVLCADLTDSTRSIVFQKEFPERFIEVGIAEQNMAGIAAGLAVCYNIGNVKLTGAHSWVSVGTAGATHQALEDIAITRCLPDMVVLAPCDAIETRKATLAASKIQGPVYLRFAREKTAVITAEETPFEIGKAEILWESSSGENPKAAIITCGPLVYKSLIATKELKEEGIEVMVVN